MYLERQDGSIKPLSIFHNYSLSEVISLMKEAAFDGLEDLT